MSRPHDSPIAARLHGLNQRSKRVFSDIDLMFLSGDCGESYRGKGAGYAKGHVDWCRVGGPAGPCGSSDGRRSDRAAGAGELQRHGCLGRQRGYPGTMGRRPFRRNRPGRHHDLVEAPGGAGAEVRFQSRGAAQARPGQAPAGDLELTPLPSRRPDELFQRLGTQRNLLPDDVVAHGRSDDRRRDRHRDHRRHRLIGSRPGILRPARRSTGGASEAPRR